MFSRSLFSSSILKSFNGYNSRSNRLFRFSSPYISTFSPRTMDFKLASELVDKEWNNTILSALSEYIKVPNQSPLFDAEILTNGLQEQAIKIVMDWVTAQVRFFIDILSP